MLDKGPKLGKRLGAAGIIKEDARAFRPEGLKHRHQPARRDMRSDDGLGGIGEPQPLERERDHQRLVVDNHLARDRHVEFAPALTEFPAIDDPRGALAEADGAVIGEVFGALRGAVGLDIGGAGHDAEAEGRGQPHADHVGIERLGKPDAGIEPGFNDIDETGIGDDLDFDLRISGAELGQHRFDHRPHHRTRNGEPQEPGRTVAQRPRRLEPGGKIGHGWPGVGEKFFARLGQSHAAGRARHQRHAHPSLERPDGLADRRRGNAQIEGGGAEAAPFGHLQEGGHPIEPAYAHMLNPLHNRHEHSTQNACESWARR